MTRQEQMYKLIAQQRRSGKKAKAFCEEQQIKLSTFNYWVRKKKENQSPSFIPIQTDVPGSECRCQLELIYPNGVRLQLKQFNLERINQLIRLQ